MTFEWGKTASCPADVTGARQAAGERKSGAQVTFGIDPETPEPERAGFCLFVIATDDRGAEGFKTHAVTLIDRKLVLTVPAQVTSGMPVKYTAAFSDDPAAAAKSQFFWGSSAAGMLPDGPCQAAEQGAAGESAVVRRLTP